MSHAAAGTLEEAVLGWTVREAIVVFSVIDPEGHSSRSSETQGDKEIQSPNLPPVFSSHRSTCKAPQASLITAEYLTAARKFHRRRERTYASEGNPGGPLATKHTISRKECLGSPAI